jgi:uncharacterized protein
MTSRDHDASVAILSEAVRRIVDTAHPLSIILFGSGARGDVDSNSDFDVMVVMPSGFHRRKTAQQIYRALLGLGYAVDVVVVTEEDLLRYRDDAGMIIATALDEGRELYAA